MEILEENSTNWLVLTPDGSTATKTKDSDLNQLLYGHNLWGLLDTGNEIWQSSGLEDEPKVTVIPDDDAECYTLQVGDAPDLILGKHHKTDLVKAMGKIYNDHDGETVAPIVSLYDRIRDNMVRKKLLVPFLDVFGDKVAEREGGWFINGHLLLTYEGDFYHPENVSRNRSGSIIGEGTSIEAYGVDIDTPTDQMQREITHEGETYCLTNSEVDFLARAMWAIENTTDRRD